MSTLEDLKKEGDAPENQSVLFRLWQRTKQRHDAASSEGEKTSKGSAMESSAQGDANTAPEQKAEEPQVLHRGFFLSEEGREDFIRMLWGHWAKSVDNAPDFNPTQLWDDMVRKGEASSTTVIAKEQESFYSQLQQPARIDYSKIRDVLVARSDAKKAAEEARRAMRKAQSEAAESQAYADGAPQEAAEGAAEETQETEIPFPAIDSSAFIRVSADKMLAWLFIMPPQNGGEGITKEKLEAELNEAKLAYGINAELLDAASEGKLYFKLLLIARGLPPVDGTDGAVKDKISDNWHSRPVEREDGLIDFKNIGTIHNITKGTVICNIILPTDGTDGMRVDGTAVPAVKGKAALIPQGACTELLPEGEALVASEDGHVVISNGKFEVKTKLSFNGDIDIATGNLNFPGNIKVLGDVREGFKVEANGTIEIKGMVEGAKIKAGGDIILGLGVNGNGFGSLWAQGDIQSKFIENCTVYAGGNITAGSIICSDVSCDGNITVRSGKGVIIGGKTTAMKSIEATAIGCESNRITTITVGNAKSLIERKHEVEGDLAKNREQLDEVKKTMVYMIERGSLLSPERREQVMQIRQIAPVLEQRIAELTEVLAQMEQDMQDVLDCRIKCNTLYPCVKISMASSFCTTEKIFTKCNIYYSDGEIVFGSQ